VAMTKQISASTAAELGITGEGQEIVISVGARNADGTYSAEVESMAEETGENESETPTADTGGEMIPPVMRKLPASA